MKTRTAFIGAILSLIPLGQPLLIKTGVVLSTAGLTISVPEKVFANDAEYYYESANKKADKGDHFGAILDYTKAIKLDPKHINAYYNRSISKALLGGIKGACVDANKVVSLGDNDPENKNWIKANC